MSANRASRSETPICSRRPVCSNLPVFSPSPSRLWSLAGQVAEKLHAYTRVYEGDRTSSRTKDLIDLALITHLFSLDAGALRAAIKAVFDNRGTHRLPQDLPLPPQEWRLPYRHLADEVGLDPDLDEGHRAAASMIDPILCGDVTTGTWRPDPQRWRTD